MREYMAPKTYDDSNFRSATDEIFNKYHTNPDLTIFNTEYQGQVKQISVADFVEQVVIVAKGLYAHNIRHGDRVAILCNTRYEWILFDYAILYLGAITVPIYPTSSLEQIEWIIADSQSQMLIVESYEQKQMIAALPSLKNNLANIFVIEDHKNTYEQLKLVGENFENDVIARENQKINADDIASIVYTSGTTGKPKGCCLTHGNFLAENEGIYATTFKTYAKPGNNFLIFLPLAHVLAKAISHFSIDKGMCLTLSSNTSNIANYFTDYQPHITLAVPRIFEKLYATVEAQANSKIQKKIFNQAVNTAIEYARSNNLSYLSFKTKAKYKVYERLVYKKIRNSLGGNLQVAISGGAPISERLLYFFQGIGLIITEGYGLTETCASLTVNTPGQIKIGSVGKPIAGNSVRINQDNEVLAKGKVVFSKYWNNPEATQESFQDNWFLTGDLGYLDQDGYLYITGRKKDLIITAGGKNVSPANFEDQLRAHSLVANVIVIGNQRPFVSALITLDDAALPYWKQQLNLAENLSKQELIKNEEIIALLQKEIDQINSTVSRAEGVKKFVILLDDFTEESGELTPSLKVKRNVVEISRADVINQLYKTKKN